MRRRLEVHSAQRSCTCIEGERALHQIIFEAVRTKRIGAKPARECASFIQHQLRLDAIGPDKMKRMEHHSVWDSSWASRVKSHSRVGLTTPGIPIRKSWVFFSET